MNNPVRWTDPTGNFHPNGMPTSEQMASKFWLINDLQTANPTITNVVGHRDSPNQRTLCPEERLNNFLRNVFGRN